MKTEHTPGPWTADVDQVFGRDGKIVADCKWTYADITLRKANALLISAAPDLMEVCKRAEEYFKHLPNTENMIGPEYGIWHNLTQGIAKAEGREL
jgi:hypothetical protein